MLVRWTALVTALVLPVAALAQNLLVSADFDVASDINDWPDPFPAPDVVISWEPPPMDVEGSPSSGSLRLQTSITNNGSDGPQQCIAANPNVSYEAEAWLFVPTQVPQPAPTLGLFYYDNPSCTGNFFDFEGHLSDSIELDTWKRIQFVTTTPPGTLGIAFRPLSGNTSVSTPVAVFYDALYLPEPGGLGGMGFGFLIVAALARRRSPR